MSGELCVCNAVRFDSLCVETGNTKITEQQGEVVEESTATEQDIYSAQGYAALPTEDVGMEEDEENSYFESGYMTLPDDDPNEDKTPILYPSNYEDIASYARSSC